MQSTIDFKVRKSIRCKLPSKIFLSDGVSKADVSSKISPNRKVAADNKTCVTPSSALSSLRIGSPNASLSQARRAFYTNSSYLPCRENELATLENFVSSNLRDGSSGSMYVSGLPGTGKTACLLQIIHNKKVTEKFHIVFVNCTAIKSSGAIYLRICEALKIKLGARSEKAAQLAIEKYLKRKHKPVLLILDEIDQLESKFQAVLYTIFEWPSLKNSRLLLIGIANAVDLTDRLLPRLSACLAYRPSLLHFRPYTKDEICTILKHRLSQAGESEIFAPGAIELISAKVAVQSGDVRRALDLGRRVLEISSESETKRPPQRQLFPDDAVRRSPRKPNFQCGETNEKLPICTETKNSEIKTSSEKIRDCSPVTEPGFNLSPTKKTHHILVKKEVPVPKEAEGDVSPRKRLIVSNPSSPGKRVRESSRNRDSLKTPTKYEGMLRSPRKCFPFVDASPIRSTLKDDDLSLRSPSKEKAGLRRVNTPKKMSTPLKNSPRKITTDLEQNSKEKENDVRRSPRKLALGSTGRYSVHASDVLSVVTQMYGTAKNLNSQQSAIPLHQKVLICSLTLIMRKGRRKDITVSKLHEVYSRVCSRRGLTAVDQSGFVSLCRQVEVTGAVELGKGPPRLAKISLLWDESEVAHALQDTSLLSAILNDASCLSGK